MARADGRRGAARAVAGAVDQAARLERSERRAHRLRADLLELRERAGGARAAVVEARQRRGLGHRQLARRLRLAQPAHEQADADPKCGRDLIGVPALRDIVSLA